MVFGQLIEQDHIEQRFMNLDAAVVVVLDESVSAKAVHEEADAGAGGTDHLCQGLLCDGGINFVGFPGLLYSAISRRILARRFSLELRS